MGTFYRGWSGALRRCTTALMMPQAAVTSAHQSSRSRETTPIATQKTSKRLQNRFDRFPRLFRTLISLATVNSSIKPGLTRLPMRPYRGVSHVQARLSVSTFDRRFHPNSLICRMWCARSGRIEGACSSGLTGAGVLALTGIYRISILLIFDMNEVLRRGPHATKIEDP